MTRKAVENLHVVNQVVDSGLCVRCGACEPACPVNIIRFNNRSYPHVTDEQSCIITCSRCLKICPGNNVNFLKLDQQMFGAQPHPESITGIAKRALVSFANDDRVRREGSSGGFVTQLLVYMFDKKLIDAALVLGSSLDSNGWHPEPFIARTPEDLKRAAKSKYMVVPFLRPLAEMEEIDGKYAVVGLPCYIHGIKKYQRVSKKLRERIKLIIGLFCNVTFEPHVLDELCEINGICKKDIVNLDFRYGTWPGGIVAQLRDGNLKKVLKLEEMKDEFNLLKMFYTPPRCNMCIDFSAEYADVAAGDPWLRGPDGKYLFPDNRTTVLIRTEIGDQIVYMAAKDGYIDVKEIPLRTFMINFERSARYKRDFVPKNIMLRRLLRLPVPKYERSIGHGGDFGFLPALFRMTILGMAKFKWFRILGLFFTQTPPAIAYFAWNRKRKEKKFAAGYAKYEKFIGKLSPMRIGSMEQHQVQVIMQSKK